MIWPESSPSALDGAAGRGWLCGGWAHCPQRTTNLHILRHVLLYHEWFRFPLEITIAIRAIVLYNLPCKIFEEQVCVREIARLLRNDPVGKRLAGLLRRTPPSPPPTPMHQAADRSLSISASLW